MKYYELTYLISPELNEEEIKNLQEKIKSLIQEVNGNLEKTSDVIQQNLASPIKKKGKAYLITSNFYLNPEKLEELEKKLKKETQILRFILLSKKVPREMPKISLRPSLKPRVKPKVKKVELKEIEKKLEEILSET